MARRRTPPRWICPVCERSVPGDVATCYCGTSRAAVEAQAERERQKSGPAFPSLTFVAEIAVIAAVFYLVLTRYQAAQNPKVSAPEAAAAEPPSALQAVPAPYSPAPESPDTAPTVVPPTTRPWTDAHEEVPSPVPVLSSPPTPRTSPSAKTERAEIDVEREAGERRLEQALAMLEVEMARLAANARQFESVCLSTRADRGSCERILGDMSSAGESLGRKLDTAEEDARHSWVSPGVVRDRRRSHGLEDSRLGDLTNDVRRLASRYRSGS